jgi:hypothetical protein
LTAAALLGTGLIIAGCAGVEPITFVADETITLRDAVEDNQSFCHIQDKEVCQSPDSQLFFHVPRRLALDTTSRIVTDEIRISNVGDFEITIDAYYIKLLDEWNYLYEPRFDGPNNYNETQPFTPALKLAAGDTVRVTFTEQLRSKSDSIKTLFVLYRLHLDTAYQQVRVSYRPRGWDAF